MKKRFLSIFLIIILAVTNLTVSYASGLEDLININLNNWDQTINEDFTNGRNWSDEALDEASATNDKAAGIIDLIIRILIFIPEKIVWALLSVIGIIVPMMDTLVFNGKGSLSLWGSFCQLSYFDAKAGIGIAGHMVGMVSSFYQVFRYVALICFVVAIACIAVKMILSSIGKQKQQYKEALKNWIVGLILLVVGHWLMIYMIYFSDYLVTLLYNIKEAVIDSTSNSLLAAFSGAVAGSMSTGLALYWVFGMIMAVVALICIIVFVGMNLKIFKVYLERVIIVGVLIMIFPLVTVFYAFEKSGIKKGSTFESWLRTFIDQVFIQPVHAISLVFVIVALNAIRGTFIVLVPIIGMVVVLMVVNVMFSIENVVKKIFAINGAALGSPVDAMKPAKMFWNQVSPGLVSGVRGFSTAFKSNNNKEFFKSLNQGAKDMHSVLHSQKSRNKAISSIFDAMGMSLPAGALDGKMSTAEDIQNKKFLKALSISSDLESGAGKSRIDMLNKRINATDPDILLGIEESIKKLNNGNGLSNKVLNRFALEGRGDFDPNTDEGKKEAALFRLYTRALVEPELDFEAYAGKDGLVDPEAVEAGLMYDDRDRTRGAKAARKMNFAAVDSDEFKAAKMADKSFAIQKPNEREALAKEFDLKEEDFEQIYAGNATAEQQLKYQCYMECVRDSKLSRDDFEHDGKLNRTEYQARIMKPEKRVADTDFMKNNWANIDVENLRAVLASHRNSNEGDFYSKTVQSGIATDTIDGFIGGDSKVDFGQLESKLRDLVTALSGSQNMSAREAREILVETTNQTNPLNSMQIDAFKTYVQAYPAELEKAISSVIDNLQPTKKGTGEIIDVNEEYIKEALEKMKAGKKVGDTDFDDQQTILSSIIDIMMGAKNVGLSSKEQYVIEEIRASKSK